MEYRVFDLSVIDNKKTSDIFDQIDNKSVNNLPLIHKKWIKNDKVYNVFKYDKTGLTVDTIETLGLWRSVVYSNKKINVFSPPKSLNINIFTNKYDASECIASEFIEGTMINNKPNVKWDDIAGLTEAKKSL